MAKFGPSNLVSEIVQNYPVLTAPAPLSAVVASLSVALGWFENEDIAAERTMGWVPRVERSLQQELEANARLGKPSTYAFNSVSEYMIQGSSFVEGSDSAEVGSAYRRRAEMSRYADHLVGVTPLQFEAVCRGILSTLGCANPYLTQYSKDEGIDFFGRLELEGRLGNVHVLGSVDRTVSMWIVGQAKHYAATRVSTPDLRELAGSVELAKTATFSGKGKGFDELKIAALDPVLYLFITTGHISSDAWTLIERSGMIAMDGAMVAAFLAENGVGMTDMAFSASAFDAWIGDQLAQP